MQLTKNRATALILSILFLASFAHAANETFYLRGTSAIETVGSQEYYSLSLDAPDASSQKTTVSRTTLAGEHEFETWFTMVTAFDFPISGDVILYFSGIGITNGTGRIRFTLADYNPSNASEETLAQSDWFAIPQESSSLELYAELSDSVVEAGHRGKLVLEYDAQSAGSTISAVLDEGHYGDIVVYSSLNATNYSFTNVSNTGALIVNTTIRSTPELPDLQVPDENTGDAEGDSVETPGISEGAEEADNCEVTCSSNSECNDSIETTTDYCRESGTCGSYCENEQCGIQCYSDSDCDDGDSLTNDSCLNAGACDSACNNNSCNPVCTQNSDCDDSDSLTLDVCAGAGRCTARCEHLANCGDNTCDPDETECSCPSDCGSCSGSISQFYEYACIGNSCQKTIKLGVCGNTRCELNENYFNCESDCRPVFFEIASSFADNFYVKGEAVDIVASLKVDGTEVPDAVVRASGFFGDIPLHNDGRHNDGTRNDNVYANQFTVPLETESGLYPVEISADFGGVEKKKIVFINISPKLSFFAQLNKEIYVLGDEITLSGTVKRKDTPVELPMDVNFLHNGLVLFESGTFSESGSFSASYRTTLLDEEGDYTIIVYARDANSNIGLLEKTITVYSPEKTNFLIVDANSGKASYAKGSEASFRAVVKGIDSKPVEGAVVEAETSAGQKFRLEETGGGVYEGVFSIPNETDSQRLSVKFTAIKGAKQGTGNTAILLENPGINVELISPAQGNFLAGDEIRIKIRASYENGEPVVSELIYATVNTETITLRGVDKGTYEGVFIPVLEDEGSLTINIALDDGYGNTASEETTIEVSGISYMYYLRAYGTGILLMLVAGSLTVFFVYINIRRVFGVKRMKAKEARLIETIKGIQTQYFVEGSLDRKNYDEAMEKYESQLQDVRESIKQAEMRAKK